MKVALPFGFALWLVLAGCAHPLDEARSYCEKLSEGQRMPAASTARAVRVGSEMVIFNKERKGCTCRFTLRDERVTHRRLDCP
jgi:hypothetical protein